MDIYIYTTSSLCIFYDVKQRFEARWRIGKGGALHLSSTEWVGRVVGKASLGDLSLAVCIRSLVFLEIGPLKILKQFFNFDSASKGPKKPVTAMAVPCAASTF